MAEKIPEMLDQAIRTTGQNPEELLLDGGYGNETVISTTLDRDISLLCIAGEPSKQPAKGKKFQKTHFRYDQNEDAYIKLEFSLHLLAYNLSRVVATCFRGILKLIWGYWMSYQHSPGVLNLKEA